MHSSLLHVARIFPEGTQERGETKILKNTFVQMFLAMIKEKIDMKKNPEMGKSRGNGEKLKGWERATSKRLLRIMSLRMCGRVQEKRRERTRATLDKETAEEARGSWIKSCSEGKVEEG